MNKFLIVFAIASFSVFAACSNRAESASTNNSPLSDSANFTTIRWTDSVINFGQHKKGEEVQIKYTCENTGTKPLFIISARPSCGCTVADYTEEAIAPGKTGEIVAIYDSNHGAAGEVRKTISVVTNTINPSPKLVFYGTIVDAAQKELQ